VQLRPARPGEEFTLVLDRNPSGRMRPSKRNPSKKVVDQVSLSINRWKGSRFERKLRVEIRELVAREVELQGCPSFLEGRPEVEVIYYFATASRLRDWQNWVPKPILDALVKAGVLLEDNDQAIDALRPILLVDRERPRIEVRIQHRS
jgi:Holliday junction resolvase RusA-like endonuclease